MFLPRRYIYLIAVICLLASCQDSGNRPLHAPVMQRTPADVNKLEDELDNCYVELAQLNKQLDSLNTALDAEKNKLDLLEDQPRQNLQQRIQQKKEVKEQGTKVQLIKEEIRAVKARIAKLNENISTIKIHLGS